MKDLDSSLMVDLLTQGIERAASNARSQLVSITHTQETLDNPIALFSNAETFGMSRSFWMTPDRDFTMIGAGEACTLTGSSNLYSDMQTAWSDLLDQAMIHNTHQAPGTGLAAVGGMAFDANKPDSGLWHEFGVNKLVIPSYIYVCYPTSCYLTVNVWVDENDQAQQLTDQLQEQIKQLLTTPQSHEQSVSPSIQQHEPITPETWKQTVQQATEAIKQSNLEKVVLARELRLDFTNKVNKAAVLQDLIATQANSYIFAFGYGKDCFIGATPEQLIKVKQKHVSSMCLAGTAPRGSTGHDDTQLAHELLHDPKNRQEHDFVVKMIQSSLDDHCQDVVIPQTPHIHKLRNLQHLYTPVTAYLKSDRDVFDLIQSLHPTPALGGVPKEMALAYIREHEHMDRGWYGAPIGWMDAYDNSEFAVAIRSALIRENEASLFAGCGLVADSDPEAEYRETAIKMKPMLNVLGG